MNNTKYIYFDNAASTRLNEDVLNKMVPFCRDEYANTSAVHSMAMASKTAVTNSRKMVAKALNCHYNEVFFTSGATESDNWALIGIAEAYREKGKHIITTTIEHNAVLDTCDYLTAHGIEVSYVGVDKHGIVSVEEIEKAIRPDTILISVMYANNEIGTIQPIKEIGEIAKKHGVLFHTDAVQGFCKEDIDVKALNIDLLSASGHKVYGPKGVGLLYVRDGVKIDRFFHGGHQEGNKRGGTLNTPSIVGFGYAVQAYMDNKVEYRRIERELRDYFIAELNANISGIHINGCVEKRLNNNVNISIEGVDNSKLLIALDLKKICVSAGSACNSGDVSMSHVIREIYKEDLKSKKSLNINGALRITLSHENTFEEIDYCVDVLKQIVDKIRG